MAGERCAAPRFARVWELWEPYEIARFHRERRSNEMNELSALAGSERYVVCDDESHTGASRRHPLHAVFAEL